MYSFMANASSPQPFSHLDEQNRPAMTDISDKSITIRVAIAESRIWLPEVVRRAFSNGDITTRKGAVFQTAIIAGIMAAKKTPELIPLCHTLLLDNCSVDIQLVEE